MEAEDIEYPAGIDYIRTVFTFFKQFAFSRVTTSVLIVFLAAQNPVYGGIWPQAQGSAFLKLSEWWTVSDQHFESNGKIVPNTHEFGYYATSISAGYSVTSQLTTTIYFPFLNYLYSLPPSGSGKISSWSLGDAELGIKYMLLSSAKTSFNLRLIVGVPLGKERGKLPGGLQSGDEDWYTGILGELGTRYHLLRSDGWLSLYGGYKKRAEGLTNEILYGAEAGLKTSNEKLNFIARLNIVDAVGEGYYPVNGQGLFSNEREYVSISPEVVYHLSSNVAIAVGAGFMLSGRNIFSNTTISLGIGHTWNPY